MRTKAVQAYSYLVRFARIHLLRHNSEREVARWFRDDGDLTLRLNYPLDQNSIVFDCGGYEGDWADAIYSRYQPMIFVFEPVQEFFERIQLRFCNNSRITVLNLGLHARTETAEIRVNRNSSSVFGTKGRVQKIRLIDVRDFVAMHHIDHIDLMKINIEGGEYDLLERMLGTGLVSRIADLQVQFHRFVPAAASRRLEIRTRLSETHYLTYDYEFVWENWRRKDL